MSEDHYTCQMNLKQTIVMRGRRHASCAVYRCICLSAFQRKGPHAPSRLNGTSKSETTFSEVPSCETPPPLPFVQECRAAYVVCTSLRRAVSKMLQTEYKTSSYHIHCILETGTLVILSCSEDLGLSSLWLQIIYRVQCITNISQNIVNSPLLVQELKI